jgi:cell division protein FtsI (penicillin-binding protein 3)
MMEGVVLHGTGKGARLTGYTAGGKTGTAQIFDTTTKRYTKMYNGSFVGFAPVTNPAVVIAVTLNGVKDFGAIVAGPVFKSVGQETLRLLGVPKDIPDVEPEPVTNPEELNDLADSGTSEPPENLAQLPQLPPAVQPLPDGRGSVTGGRGSVTGGRGSVTGGRGPVTDVRGSGQAPAVVAVSGPAVPSFQGKSVRAVLEQSLAAGIPVDVIGSGVARQQAPAAGSYLNRGERVRVQFQ